MCGRELPEEANECPSCGYPVHKRVPTEILLRREMQTDMRDVQNLSSDTDMKEKPKKNIFSLLGLVFSSISMFLILLMSILIFFVLIAPALVISVVIIIFLLGLSGFAFSIVGVRQLKVYGHRGLAMTALCLSSAIVGLFAMSFISRILLVIIF